MELTPAVRAQQCHIIFNRMQVWASTLEIRMAQSEADPELIKRVQQAAKDLDAIHHDFTNNLLNDPID